MSSDCFRVKLTDVAKDDLRRIRRKYGQKTYDTLKDLICDLEFEPTKKGEPLRGVLSGLYSRHYSRFRIVYQVRQEHFEVITISCGFHETGSRSDIYEALTRMIESGKFDDALRRRGRGED